MMVGAECTACDRSSLRTNPNRRRTLGPGNWVAADELPNRDTRPTWKIYKMAPASDEQTVLPIPKQFLFPAAFPCYRQSPLRLTGGGVVPDERWRLADLSLLESPESRNRFVEWYAAWNHATGNDGGLMFTIRVTGRRTTPWCRPNRLTESDRVEILIDTRNVRDAHRATRYCHRFVFMPCGTGSQMNDPFAAWLPIHRAKDHPNPFPEGRLRVAATIMANISGTVENAANRENGGFVLNMMIPQSAMTGFDPVEYPAIGFAAIVFDREHGVIPFGPGTPLPLAEDPSLWATLDLVES
jgi:hypothetical protein